MKLKVLLGSLAWALFVTVLHLQLNVGWDRLGHRIKVLLGEEREELIVGFLPVT
jgi:hypothetical protein